MSWRVSGRRNEKKRTRQQRSHYIHSIWVAIRSSLCECPTLELMEPLYVFGNVPYLFGIPGSMVNAKRRRVNSRATVIFVRIQETCKKRNKCRDISRHKFRKSGKQHMIWANDSLKSSLLIETAVSSEFLLKLILHDPTNFSFIMMLDIFDLKEIY